MKNFFNKLKYNIEVWWIGYCAIILISLVLTVGENRYYGGYISEETAKYILNIKDEDVSVNPYYIKMLSIKGLPNYIAPIDPIGFTGKYYIDGIGVVRRNSALEKKIEYWQRVRLPEMFSGKYKSYRW